MNPLIYDILEGKKSVRHEDLIRTALHFIRSSKGASGVVKQEEPIKAQEAKTIIEFSRKKNLLIRINPKLFVSSGAEQKVYLNPPQYVLKINDAIYFSSWVDYFHNLLLHNYFFPDTAYELVGFYLEKDVVYAVVQQQFVQATTITDLKEVRLFMLDNGFVNTRNNDYYHAEMGLILEDLHDENVLTRNDLLFFIDTVFYLDERII